MFRKILIANRGEIACRVIKTAHKLGVATVAVYSDADQHALHVKLADEAVRIGPAPSSSSYLLGDKVIEAALQTGAEAIHPGYGFLSENAAFSEACEKAGLVFIGPPAAAIEAMGSKSAAKRIMGEAGVPLVPGYHGADQSAERLLESANEMGYPVLLKAVAGGGGKGMRQVWGEDEFADALAAAKREAQASFGNDDMLVEKYLTQPRHVEVQVFCDQQHDGVYLFERDCSVQRRHQKVIEEAPAPGMTEALRQEMGEAAVRAAQAIDYVGAGTVEFLLDIDGSFYFMEMNTRLQVEHPVTELITGQDLVEWQLRVAAGEPLPLQQHELRINGHAFEARVYAEDPDNEFLPATGTLHYLQPPAESKHVRVDTGVVQGDEVSVYYDPMIAKLIVWDTDRKVALQRLTDALLRYKIAGVKNNIKFLARLSASEPFNSAQLDTGFIERHNQLLFPPQQSPSDEQLVSVGLCQYLAKRESEPQAQLESNSPWRLQDDWRMNHAETSVEEFEIEGQTYQVSITSRANGQRLLVTIEDREFTAQAELNGDHLAVTIGDHSTSMSLARHQDSWCLFTASGQLEFLPLNPDLGEGDRADAGGFLAPMNGTVVEVMVCAGQQVAEGEALVIIEAMKMEHTIRAHADGTVTEVFFGSGDLVDGGAELLHFEVRH